MSGSPYASVFDVAVIGRASIGMAAALALARSGLRVAMVGPDAPGTEPVLRGPAGDWDNRVFALSPSTLVLTMTKILPGTELWDDAKKFRYEFDTGAQYEMTGSSTVTRKDIGEMVRFRDAVEFAYNRLHAVRTIGWLAGELGIRPSAIYVEIGRRMAIPGKAPAAFTVDDLSRFLSEIAADRGRAELGKAAADKLGSEDLLNRLQRNREVRRTWWANFVFRVGYRLLTRFGGLPPLPKPEPAKVLHDAPEGAAAVA